MSGLRVDSERCDGCGRCVDVCPFRGIVLTDDVAVFTESCRACPICARECPTEAIFLEEEVSSVVPGYSGVLVVAELRGGLLQPVSAELVGEGRRLADLAGFELHAVVLGSGCRNAAEVLLQYGVDTVQMYDHPELEHFRSEPYTDALEDAVKRLRPAVALMAGTPKGRSLAPRLATRLRTGLTADCTALDLDGEGRLLQTRPAFGGDVMATIATPTGRPQMATVRPSVMPPAEKVEWPAGEVIEVPFQPAEYRSRVLEMRPAPEGSTIADAEVVVAAGRGIRRKEDLEMLEELAGALGGMVGCTRPLVEAGWLPSTRQVGLSGRTVRARLYIACGISGAIQHTAGMRSSERIIAINADADAPIFDAADLAVVGDLYEILPVLLESIERGESLYALRTRNG